MFSKHDRRAAVEDRRQQERRTNLDAALVDLERRQANRRAFDNARVARWVDRFSAARAEKGDEWTFGKRSPSPSVGSQSFPS